MRNSKSVFIPLLLAFFAIFSWGYGQAASNDKQAWVSVGQFKSSGNFASCQRYDLSKLTSTLLVDQLKASGRFRLFTDERIAELRFGGEITSCNISVSQILFVTTVNISFSVNITAVDIVTSEQIISETVKGETSNSNISLIGNFVSDADFKSAIEGVFKEKIPQLVNGKELLPYMTHILGERPTLPATTTNPNTQTPNPTPIVAPTPPNNAATSTSVTSAIDAMFNGLKNMDFNSFNNSLSDNLLNLSSIGNLSQYATPENKSISSKITYFVQSVQDFQNAYTVVDLLVIIPTSAGASTTKNYKIGVIDTGGNLSQAFPNRKNQGLKILFLDKINPLRGIPQLPIFNSSSEAVEQLLKDFNAALGINL